MAALSREAKRYKEDVVDLRKQGLSYREILAQIPVAKSTVALWLQSVGLSQKQKQRLTERKVAAALSGGKARRKHRIWETRQIMDAAKSEIGPLSWREFWLMGVMLYWAEGSKEKDYRPDARVQFTNTDSRMIRLFLLWLDFACGIDSENITLEVYIHETSRYRMREIINYWSQEDFP
jgi:hypothetical protein